MARFPESDPNAEQGEGAASKDVAVVRFPAAVSTPVSAKAFSGQVVLRYGLTSTGSRVYDPPNLPIAEPVTAYVVNGRIDRFEGRGSRMFREIREHYERVANRFGIEPMIVDSWHQGLHPGTDASPDPADDLCLVGRDSIYESAISSFSYLRGVSTGGDLLDGGVSDANPGWPKTL